MAEQSNNVVQLRASRSLPLVWARDIEIKSESNYLIKGLLDSSAMSAVYGPSNVGKSFFAIDLALCVASGREWRGERTTPGAVIYVAAESGESVQRRVYALLREHGLTDVPFAVVPTSVDLQDPRADTTALIALIEEAVSSCNMPVVLVVIDTLSRSFGGGDENKTPDMPQFIANIDRIRDETGAHVLIVHHAGKDEARGMRGHSSLRAATDTEISIKRAPNGEFSIARVDKQRDGQSGDAHQFRLRTVTLGVDQDGDPITTAVLEHMEEPVGYAGPKLSDRQQRAKAALFQYWRASSPSADGITFEQFREIMLDAGIVEEDDNRLKQRLSELRLALEKKGIIRIQNRFVQLHMEPPNEGEN